MQICGIRILSLPQKSLSLQVLMVSVPWFSAIYSFQRLTYLTNLLILQQFQSPNTSTVAVTGAAGAKGPWAFLVPKSIQNYNNLCHVKSYRARCLWVKHSLNSIWLLQLQLSIYFSFSVWNRLASYINWSCRHWSVWHGWVFQCCAPLHLWALSNGHKVNQSANSAIWYVWYVWAAKQTAEGSKCHFPYSALFSSNSTHSLKLLPAQTRLTIYSCYKILVPVMLYYHDEFHLLYWLLPNWLNLKWLNFLKMEHFVISM